MELFLGIDAGGTKTEYAIGDGYGELARVSGGSIKRLRVDAATARPRWERAMCELRERSQSSLSDVVCTCIGTSGVDVPLVADFLTEQAVRTLPGELLLLSDMEIAPNAAFPDGSGGCGSCRNGLQRSWQACRAESFTVGGWGPILGDQGSGFQIGLAALRAAFLARDEGRSSILLDEILRSWNLPSIASLVDYANRETFPDYASLAPVLVEAWAKGEVLAAEIVLGAADDLSNLIHSVLERLNSADIGRGPVDTIAFTSSIAARVQPFRERIVSSVRRSLPKLSVVESAMDRIKGALYRAR